MNYQTARWGRIPLLLRRGGCGFNKKSRSHRGSRRRGGRSQAMVQERIPPTSFVSDHPVRSIIRRLRDILFDVASTPPREEGNNDIHYRVLGGWNAYSLGGSAPNRFLTK